MPYQLKNLEWKNTWTSGFKRNKFMPTKRIFAGRKTMKKTNRSKFDHPLVIIPCGCQKQGAASCSMYIFMLSAV